MHFSVSSFLLPASLPNSPELLTALLAVVFSIKSAISQSNNPLLSILKFFIQSQFAIFLLPVVWESKRKGKKLYISSNFDQNFGSYARNNIFLFSAF